MNGTKKIIVITDSFLLSAGIESLALEISGLLVDHIFSGSEKRLGEKVVNKKPEFVIIDPESIDDNLIPILREIGDDPDIKTIGLISSYTNDNIVSRFSYTLNREDNKYKIIEELQKIVGNNNSHSDNEQVISKREIEILRNLSLGLTNQEVADKLFLSIHTVMTHRKKITRKLGIKTVSGLTVYALINNIVDIREIERNV